MISTSEEYFDTLSVIMVNQIRLCALRGYKFKSCWTTEGKKDTNPGVSDETILKMTKNPSRKLLMKRLKYSSFQEMA